MLVEKLKEGQNIALITDAGTPGISDPGEDLVRICQEEGVPVTSLPGACACVTALTLSGLSTRRFCFEAFLPTEKKDRQLVLAELKEETPDHDCLRGAAPARADSCGASGNAGRPAVDDLPGADEKA